MTSLLPWLVDLALVAGMVLLAVVLLLLWRAVERINADIYRRQIDQQQSFSANQQHPDGTLYL